MATIDPSIALGVKPVQIEDPINRFARQQELNVNMMKAQEMNQAVQDRNLLRQLDPSSKDYISQVGRINPKLALELQEGRLKTKKTGLEIDEKQLALHRERVADLAFNPSDNNVLAHLEDGVLKGNITPEQAKQQWAQVGAMNPDQRKQYFTQMGVNAEKRLSDLTTRRGQDITAATTRRGQDLQYDPDLQAKIAGAKKRAEGEVAREVQGQVDVVANRKALATAGYDAATGKDDISELIKKSTGSYLGKAIDIGERVYGGSNEGSRALQTLTQKANAITFGLLNGKLGAGISKSDAELVASLVGQLGDGTLPVADRLAAWESAKNNMVRLGMIEAPKAPANNVNVPGVGTQVNTPGSGAAPAAKPTLDSIFGTSKK
jgi:hypothetical protein